MVRRVEESETGALADVLTRAFADDPNFSALHPDRGPRLRALRRTFVAQARSTLPLGVVYGAYDDDGALAGAAVWHPPGSFPLGVRLQLRALPAALAALASAPGAARRTLGMVRTMDALRPREDHWYLATIGVDPARAGAGHGRALLQPTLARADAERLPAYLETAKEGNAAWYERHGFATIGRAHLVEGGPSCWLMRREP